MQPCTNENQNPEQKARDAIDAQLRAAGWEVQHKKDFDSNLGQGQAVREYQTDTGPADYVLFIDRKPIGVIEAKKETMGQNITTVEEQTGEYASAKLKWVQNTGDPLPFLYEATGVITRFTDQRDPKPRSREIFSFHRPETLREWLGQGRSLRTRLKEDVPPLDPIGLRDCQIEAITNLDQSFAAAKPRALIQMATGSGKTFTAITSIYRLLKHAGAKRVLFLVDTKNLGEQAEQEFMAYTPNDDNRKFTELYTVQRLRSSVVPKDGQVCISTIQRMYSILQGTELDESAEEDNPAETRPRRKEPMPVAYNEKVPIEHFDFIVVDECHRSIYNLWRQVLEYFDAFLIGLTATPDARTYGFFKQNVVSEYDHEKAVADGVNVGNEVFVIQTDVSEGGGTVLKGLVEKRHKLTRKKRWETEDEDQNYSAKKLDKDIVNPDQIEPAEQLLERIRTEREARYAQQLTDWKIAVAEWEVQGKEGNRPKKPKALNKTEEPTEEELLNSFRVSDAWVLLSAEALGDVQLGRQRSPKNISKDYPTKYIRAANITESGLALDDILEMEFTPNEKRTFELEYGDLVLSEASGSAAQVGKPAMWRNEIENCCFQNTVIRQRLHVPEFCEFYLWLYKFYYLHGIFSKTAGGVGINHLSAGKFSRIPVPLCSVPEQKEIVRLLEAQFEAIEQNEREIDAALERSAALRQSILKRAFSGKLVEQDPNDEPARILLERIRIERETKEAKKPKKKAIKKRARKMGVKQS